ncbi:MAG: ribbon-helix-helix domain-containing protein [Planctomycetaceae bacterium]|nr:ribbon-helix-helix domain-containing protein [Planctomycetaceae bacterium]
MSLDLDLAERVREISDRSGRSMSYVIEKCVAGYLPVMENGVDEDTKGPTKKTMYDMIQEMFAFFRAAGMKPELV